MLRGWHEYGARAGTDAFLTAALLCLPLVAVANDPAPGADHPQVIEGKAAYDADIVDQRLRRRIRSQISTNIASTANGAKPRTIQTPISEYRLERSPEYSC